MNIICLTRQKLFQIIYLVASILQDFFDGDQVIADNEPRLVDDTERAVANHFGVRVRYFLGLLIALAFRGYHGGQLWRVLAFKQIS